MLKRADENFKETIVHNLRLEEILHPETRTGCHKKGTISKQVRNLKCDNQVVER